MIDEIAPEKSVAMDDHVEKYKSDIRKEILEELKRKYISSATDDAVNRFYNQHLGMELDTHDGYTEAYRQVLIDVAGLFGESVEFVKRHRNIAKYHIYYEYDGIDGFDDDVHERRKTK